jgi:cytochrome c biogenesis protein CcdA
MDLGYLASFLGGTLSLLSPCGALLLPAFFAATAGSGPRLLGHGAVFFLGLSASLVPLGLGASLVGSVLTAQRELVIAIGGWLIIGFGVLSLVGKGFDPLRLIPGGRSWQAGTAGQAGLVRSFLLGTVSGIAGFCSGPILGAVLTLAATSGSPAVGSVMLAVYGAGMVVPLLALAATWSRLGSRGRQRLRGGQLHVGRWQAPTLSVVTGVVLIALGAVFLLTDGMAALPELLPATLLGEVQAWVLRASSAVPEWLVIILAALIALGMWWRHSKAAVGAASAEPANREQLAVRGESPAVREPDQTGEPASGR